MKKIVIILISLIAFSVKAKNRMDEILLSGNGQTFETAYKVYNVDEQYGTLQYLKKLPNAQSLVNYKNELYDVFKDAKSGENIYFKIIQKQQPKKEVVCL